MKNKNWWLKKDCRKCIRYPHCDFVETKVKTPKGCSLYEDLRQEMPGD